MDAATVRQLWLELWERARGFTRLIGKLGVRVCASMPLFGTTPVTPVLWVLATQWPSLDKRWPHVSYRIAVGGGCVIGSLV